MTGRPARRAVLLSAAAAGLVLPTVAHAAITPVSASDMVLGRATAKVTVIEYASASCPHCARWNQDVFPELKRRFIDTGKVRFAFREILTSPANLAAAGFLIARCAGRAKYFQTIDAVFAAQAGIYEAGDMRAGLLAVAQGAGMTEAQYDACLADQAAITALSNRVKTWSEHDGIHSTPTFVVGTELIEGEQTIDVLAAAIDRAAKARRRPASRGA